MRRGGALHEQLDRRTLRCTRRVRGDGQLELLYPASKGKARVSYRAWKCSEKKDFDFCLEVTGGKGAKKYYSQRGWEIGSLEAERRWQK